MQQSVSIILKISNICNLKCKHCYEGEGLCNNNSIMPLETLEKIFSLAQSQYKSVTYVWFGGEPLCAGLEYFQKAIDLQEKHNHDNIISNRIQTNATLMTKEFAQFFISEKFALSISYDAQYNDCLRQKTEQTLVGINNIKQLGGNCGILSTIHSKNFDKQIEMYEYIKSLGCPMKFNPIFPSGVALKNQEFLLDVNKYVDETVKLFEHWCNDKNAVPISNLVQYLILIQNLPGKNCTFGKCLYKWLCIEPNGDIFPCSRFYDSQYKIGHLDDVTQIEDIFSWEKYNKIAKQVIDRRLNCRDNCEVYKYCNGGCNSAAANEKSLSESGFQQCQITKLILPRIIEIVNNIKQTGKVANKIVEKMLFPKQ